MKKKCTHILSFAHHMRYKYKRTEKKNWDAYIMYKYTCIFRIYCSRLYAWDQADFSFHFFYYLHVSCDNDYSNNNDDDDDVWFNGMSIGP